MNTQNYTQKTIEAINTAISMAKENRNTQLEPAHLLYALLDQDGGLIPNLFGKMGADVNAMLGETDALIDALPRAASETNLSASADFTKVTDAAEKEAKKAGDRYVSVEHLLLGFFELPGRNDAKRVLSDHAITRQSFVEALSKVKSAPVTGDNPEDTYDALSKYGTDLVKRARENELDPVIGRDAEIRNVIRILSRKTKNNPVLIGEPGVGKT
ncbi:MAG: type VI secretion system ATPase TssH, partial [Oscillospiraceae bacterium]|nr:type VI secretion system ATPase TssH [Oscillospiraceae bacterium]